MSLRRAAGADELTRVPAFGTLVLTSRVVFTCPSEDTIGLGCLEKLHFLVEMKAQVVNLPY